MGLVRLGLVVLLSTVWSMGVAHAQMDDRTQVAESQLPPTDYGAGYKIIIFHQRLEHPPGLGDDQFKQGPITLDSTYPLIASPLTADAKKFNAEMHQLAGKWQSGQQYNTTDLDSDFDVTSDCEPVGLSPPPDVDGIIPSGLRMVPGVVSDACEVYSYMLGAAHGGGDYWGFNWLLHARRVMRASDIFDVRTKWLEALTKKVNADRSAGFNGVQFPLDVSDTTHWIVTTEGLGLTYPDSYFSGFEEGGEGMYDLIPWSKLAPYLRKDGIVPQADWSATAARSN